MVWCGFLCFCGGYLIFYVWVLFLGGMVFVVSSGVLVGLVDVVFGIFCVGFGLFLMLFFVGSFFLMVESSFIWGGWWGMEKNLLGKWMGLVFGFGVVVFGLLDFLWVVLFFLVF